ncbi:hypothetical protein NPIL_423721, partial [Nephila pilipes]
SSEHASDLMKMTGAPVIHVNGDHPEFPSKIDVLLNSYSGNIPFDKQIPSPAIQTYPIEQISSRVNLSSLESIY